MKLFEEGLASTDHFVDRHIGPSDREAHDMLKFLGFSTLEELSVATVPSAIRLKKPLQLGLPQSETEKLAELKTTANENKLYRSFIGLGYTGTVTPPVLQRNILENPGWYTQYTPYQAEISQGRLEALLNFQTMVMDLTGLDIANASLLDEGTAAAEAVNVAFNAKGRDGTRTVFVSSQCFPQTIEIIKTRMRPFGVEVVTGEAVHCDFQNKKPFALVVQNPCTNGEVVDYTELFAKAHANDCLAIAVADILSLALVKSPGEMGADLAVGSTQRFGVPMGFGGPHAAYMAAKDEFKRIIPGRIVGISKDADGNAAIRMALQTREQHIRREKATSNICTAQVLLAIISAMYATYHGPEGIKNIGLRVFKLTELLRAALTKLGYKIENSTHFDTLTVRADSNTIAAVLSFCEQDKINLHKLGGNGVGVTLDETVTPSDLRDLVTAFAKGCSRAVPDLEALAQEVGTVKVPFARQSDYLKQPVFNKYHCETEMLRYLHRLQAKDLSLTGSMIPLGSCTMKLNAAAEMFPISWPEFAKIHPFAPSEQTKGYQKMIRQLSDMLGEITGLPGVSLQPNAGSQGEYAGLLVIRKFHESQGRGHRNICLIPKSAHGTNPASAALAGMQVVVVDCDENGNIHIPDLKAKAQEHANNLAAIMVTYPSTHGVFEEAILEISSIVHSHGGQVYMDGANMNAQVGLTRPSEIGADVCHLNLHKTFAIPHGGGGPGVGPICVKSHLTAFLPNHPVVNTSTANAVGPVSAAPWGSAGVLPISWMYIAMMGEAGLKKATQVAILNANYIAKKLDAHYPVLYRGKNGMVAHECILDCRPIKEATGIEAEDIAKRLMDYGFHAPTMSFPVPGTLMVEPTESESKVELDRFIEAMIEIRKEINEIEKGQADKLNNVLKNAPHTAAAVSKSEWTRPYAREKAAYPVPSLRTRKFWPAVARVNNVLGDRQLICSCPAVEEYI